MNKLMLALGTSLALFGAQAIAQEATDPTVSYTFADLQQMYPDLTEDGFNSIDANADGVVDSTELSAAIADGSLPQD